MASMAALVRYKDGSLDPQVFQYNSEVPAQKASALAAAEARREIVDSDGTAVILVEWEPTLAPVTATDNETLRATLDRKDWRKVRKACKDAYELTHTDLWVRIRRAINDAEVIGG